MGDGCLFMGIAWKQGGGDTAIRRTVATIVLGFVVTTVDIVAGVSPFVEAVEVVDDGSDN